MNSLLLLEKREGETPLQMIERFRLENKEYSDIKMTYAGRLDPLASGLIVVLTGDRVHEKDDFLNLDKEYELEIMFGFSTDSHDILGLLEESSAKELIISVNEIDQVLSDFIKKFDQPYPVFSSKTIQGNSLWSLFRAGIDIKKKPSKNVEIYSIDVISQDKIYKNDLFPLISQRISQVSGDFRQVHILEKWQKTLENSSSPVFPVAKIRVSCSSGTYMRVLAYEIGKKMGFPALAWRIRRTKVGQYEIGNKSS